ncbi:MAG: hypothetical protein N0E44_18235 [Candidatus Thiodiazotropha lotti]|nr:hypothetical protein [Candidatus Thiodiazotropha lotti]MCW4221823.1 hypothetical protein [Candidatus Thiodiazotropha lotti]
MGSFGGGKIDDSESSKELARIGNEEWERYQTDFAPQEKEYIKDVTELGSAREKQTLKGRGISELRQQSGPAKPTRQSGLVRRGSATMKGEADITTDTNLKATARKGKGINSAVGLGRNVATGAQAGLSRSAQMQTTKNIASAQAESIENAGKWDAVGTAAGMGIQRYGPDVKQWAKTASGSTYNTDFGSTQSTMLADQDWGIRR